MAKQIPCGFNIGTNITTDGLIPDSIDEGVAQMNPWYDNYCFSIDSLGQTMYNSDMVLYFLNTYLMKGKAPKEMIDKKTVLRDGIYRGWQPVALKEF